MHQNLKMYLKSHETPKDANLGEADFEDSNKMCADYSVFEAENILLTLWKAVVDLELDKYNKLRNMIDLALSHSLSGRKNILITISVKLYEFLFVFIFWSFNGLKNLVQEIIYVSWRKLVDLWKMETFGLNSHFYEFLNFLQP